MHVRWVSHLLSTSCLSKRQRAGIRQGGPLSPFLFVILLTVMLEDIHVEEERALKKGRANGMQYNELHGMNISKMVATCEKTKYLQRGRLYARWT